MTVEIREISSLIKQEISRYKSEIDVAQVGTVLEVGDGIARIYGLDNAMAGEMLEFEGGVVGEVFNLEEDSVGAVIYGDYTRKSPRARRSRSTGKVLSVPVGSGTDRPGGRCAVRADRRRGSDSACRTAGWWNIRRRASPTASR